MGWLPADIASKSVKWRTVAAGVDNPSGDYVAAFNTEKAPTPVSGLNNPCVLRLVAQVSRGQADGLLDNLDNQVR